MRGDSLRDFYAKTLAVIGLGLLAMAGALIDYWPAGGDLPALSRATGIRPTSPAIVHNFDRAIPAPVVRNARAVVDPLPVVSVEPTAPVTADWNTAAAGLAPAPPAPIEATPPPDFLVVTDAVPSDWIFASLVLEPAPMLAPVSAAPSAGLQDIVTGALKRTRESIREARSSIRGALSGMVGAVRRVSPFFSTTATFSSSF